MPELIDRYATMDAIPAPIDADEAEYYGKICDAIETMPAIEAEPVRHGEWHECWHTDTVCASICTNCGKVATQARVIVGQELMTNVRYSLCPNCGARMDADHIADDSKKVGDADNGNG